MAEGILILKTTPGRILPAGLPVVAGSYEALFIYHLDPAIVDFNKVKVAPTPSARLLQLLGQTTFDRYVKDPAPTRFDDGDWAWELETGERRLVRDAPDGPLRLETRDEMIARLSAQWAVAKARAVAEWTETYRFSGRFLPA